jgi:hypothetical protein
LAEERGKTTVGLGAGSPARDYPERWDAEAPSVTLAQAAALIPPRRRGRKTHVSTLYRWSTTGCRGVVLPTIQVGGSRCTSAEALQWFCEVLTELSHDPGGQAGAEVLPLRCSPAQRRRESEAAGERLEQMGA